MVCRGELWPADLETVFKHGVRTVAEAISSRYRIPIVTGDVGPESKGDLDGAEIVIATGSDAETTLFLLAHLFGHTVQWNTCARSRRIGMHTAPGTSQDWSDELEAYETEACRYGQTLLHDAGVCRLDQWLADYAACDAAYLRHFYATGTRADFFTFWRSGQPLLEPLAPRSAKTARGHRGLPPALSVPRLFSP